MSRTSPYFLKAFANLESSFEDFKVAFEECDTLKDKELLTAGVELKAAMDGIEALLKGLGVIK